MLKMLAWAIEAIKKILEYEWIDNNLAFFEVPFDNGDVGEYDVVFHVNGSIVLVSFMLNNSVYETPPAGTSFKTKYQIANTIKTILQEYYDDKFHEGVFTFNATSDSRLKLYKTWAKAIDFVTVTEGQKMYLFKGPLYEAWGNYLNETGKSFDSVSYFIQSGMPVELAA